MFAMINTKTSTVAFPCPHCYKLYIVDLAKFSEANNYQCGFRCAACDTVFIVELESLTRATELRNEAEAGAVDLPEKESGK